MKTFNIATLTPPAVDFAGWPTFSPTGDLIFSSATIDRGEDFPPMTRPGYLSLVRPPYTNPPETLFFEDGVYPPSTWLDDNHILYDTADDQIGVVNLEGQSQKLPIFYTVAVLP